jgi:uncharacterized protein (UPF0254 family)
MEPSKLQQYMWKTSSREQELTVAVFMERKHMKSKRNKKNFDVRVDFSEDKQTFSRMVKDFNCTRNYTDPSNRYYQSLIGQHPLIEFKQKEEKVGKVELKKYSESEEHKVSVETCPSINSFKEQTDDEEADVG